MENKHELKRSHHLKMSSFPFWLNENNKKTNERKIDESLRWYTNHSLSTCPLNSLFLPLSLSSSLHFCPLISMCLFFCSINKSLYIYHHCSCWQSYGKYVYAERIYIFALLSFTKSIFVYTLYTVGIIHDIMQNQVENEMKPTVTWRKKSWKESTYTQNQRMSMSTAKTEYTSLTDRLLTKYISNYFR